MNETVFYDVAVNTPFNNSVLTYKAQSDKEYKSGDLVLVPLGKRECLGCILGPHDETSTLSEEKLKFISSDSAYDFSIEQKNLHFLKWISDYYHYPVGQLVSDILPKPLKKPRPLKSTLGRGKPLEFELNDNQTEVFTSIRKGVDNFGKYLVHGVTGSGKSAIYLKLIQEVINKDRCALFLLPEINLTPQFIDTFAEHISAPIYIYNSSVSNSDKLGLWRHLSQDKGPCLVIGVRSSIFLPVKNLGLIVVDEEHDSSFKQEDRCPYNARDLAIKKAQLEDCPVVLGSATPSLESYVQFKKNKQYFTLKKRAISKKLPRIKLLDMRGGQEHTPHEESLWPFHSDSLNALKKVLEKGEQALVFLNKLGYADFLQCKMCGHHFSCPNCSANLKFYKARNEISCQICAYRDKPPEICPSCQSLSIQQKGFGTEKITEFLREKLPAYKIERFDRDEITNFNELKKKLKSFHDGEIDVFVGTQMLSKGHNFKNVNLVLVMGIDAQLNFPDYKATERAFQLLTQISGRPGRFGDESEVMVHTLNTDNPLFKTVVDHDFDGFYEQEIELRHLCECPPFTKLAMLYVTAKTRELTSQQAIKLTDFLNILKNKHFKSLEILGPRPSIIEKRVNKFTWAIMLRSEDVNQLHNALKTLRANFKWPSGVSLKLDVDPYHLY